MRLALAALAPLLMLLTACIPQAADNPASATNPTPTTTPQTASPNVSFPPTATAQSEGTIERTAQPTPELLDEPIVPATVVPDIGEVPLALLDAIIADLAERLEISAEEIAIVQARAVEWNDGSLGCPQPGMMYIQVITPGYRVVLHANGKVYDYHTDTRGRFILCGENGLSIEPTPLMPVAPHKKP